jgi:NAD(P)-dependent dehydrogenase (short-subunit alcohol dehydrogenase family)
MWADMEPRGQSYQQVVFLTPLRRWARPDDIAAAVAFLASKDASHITGAALPVDGGITVGSPASVEPWPPLESVQAKPRPHE